MGKTSDNLMLRGLRILLGVLAVGQSSFAEQLCHEESADKFSVLSWNIWHPGHCQYLPEPARSEACDGVKGILRDSKADVILTIETRGCAKDLEKFLGYYHDEISWNLSIYSKYPIEKVYSFPDLISPISFGGALINIDGRRVRVFNTWLNYAPDICWAPLEKGAEALEAWEKAGSRDNEVAGILRAIEPFMKEADKIPIIIGGDFNSFSHLDWTENMKDLCKHQGLSVRWPVSVMMNKAGFVDSYREIYPCPVTNPGITWSASWTWAGDKYVINRQDRIDFIYYLGQGLRVYDSETRYTEQGSKLQYRGRKYTFGGDHGFVHTTFQFKWKGDPTTSGTIQAVLPENDIKWSDISWTDEGKDFSGVWSKVNQAELTLKKGISSVSFDLPVSLQTLNATVSKDASLAFYGEAVKSENLVKKGAGSLVLKMNVPVRLKQLSVEEGTLVFPPFTKVSIDNLIVAAGCTLEIPTDDLSRDPWLSIKKITVPSHGKIYVRMPAPAKVAQGQTFPVLAGVSAADADCFVCSSSGVKGKFSVNADGMLVLTATEGMNIADGAYQWKNQTATWNLTDKRWALETDNACAFRAGGNAVLESAGSEDRVTVAKGVTAGSVSVRGSGDLTLDGDRILGSGIVDKDGTGTLTVDGGGLGSRDVMVTKGTLRLGEKAGENALGDVGSKLVIRDGATFDVNSRKYVYGEVGRSEITHNKDLYVSGAGVDGRGAIVNHGIAPSRWTFQNITLLGNTVFGCDRRWDLAQYIDFPRDGRARLSGPKDATLTIEGKKGCEPISLIDADVSVWKIVLRNQGKLRVEDETSLDVSHEIVLDNGGMLDIADSCNWGRRICAPVTVRGKGNNLIQCSMGTARFGAPVSVGNGSALELRSGTQRYEKGISGDDVVVTDGDIYFGDDHSDQPCCFPKRLALKGGCLSMLFCGSPHFHNLEIRGTGGEFWPAFTQQSGSTSYYENCSFEIPKLLLATANGEGHIVLGKNTRVKAGSISTANNQNNARAASIFLKDGAELDLTDWSLTIGNTDTRYRQEMVIDNATVRSPRNPVYLGWYAKNCFLWLNQGLLTSKGLVIRSTAADSEDFWKNTEAFVMNGGTYNLGGPLTTSRGAAYLPMVYWNGGVINSTADWNTTDYFNLSFGGFNGAKDGAVKLNVANHQATLKGVLQGGAAVTLSGNGNFLNESVPQGIVAGNWRIENTGRNLLLGAAGFKKGLTLEEDVKADINIHAPNRYVSMAAYTAGSREIAKNFHEAGISGYPWLGGSMHEALLRTSVPQDNIFAYQGYFYVEPSKKGVWTFACTYNHEMKLSVDGELLCATSAPREVSKPVQISLEPGWHDFRLTARSLDAENDAGPAVADWKAAKIAAGFHIGATGSTAASDYTRFDTDTLTMRPMPCQSVLHRRISHDVKTDGWETRSDYDKVETLHSLAGIHSRDWSDGKYAINEFSGFFSVDRNEGGKWTFWGQYDERILLEIDGKLILKTADCASREVTTPLQPGWHAFRVRTLDTNGACGVVNSKRALYFMRPSDAGVWKDHSFFEETNFRVVVDPHAAHTGGKIGGALVLRKGSALTNRADSPASLTGVISGCGVLKGAFCLDGGTYTMEGTPAVQKLSGVTFGDGACADALKNVGKIEITFSGEPTRPWYEIGEARGLEQLSAKELQSRLTVLLSQGNGELKAIAGQYTLEVRPDKKLILQKK